MIQHKHIVRPERGLCMQVSGDTYLGKTVDKYRLLSVLGTGSMSVVYLAQRLDDPRVLVAVKILHPQAASSPEERSAFRQRFLREARAASKLRNEYILPVLSSGDIDGMPFMVLPVIVGGTLAMRLAHQSEPMPLGEVTRYLKQLASAIDYAHEQGVIHRDIKPANILLDEHGHVYLTDFGIARLFDSGENALTRESPLTLTRTGQVLGTPYYMAPEQIKGLPVTASADIYALGVVLYQLVTGQVPFHGDTPLAVALQHLQEPPSPPGMLRHELPPPLEAVILRALAKNPEDRFASAMELADAFEIGLAELGDPMATQAPSETWPFSTGLAQRASITPTTASTPMSLTRALSEKVVGATIDGYRIGALIESSDLGAVFTAYRDGSAEPVRIRFLPIPVDIPPKQIASYLLRFEQQAQELARLRHPNLVPVLGYGTYEGLPYLITPDNQGRSLSIELAQHGAAELPAIADCLDQVVAALDYAHQRGILHLSLTPDAILRHDDGSILVADIGIRGMLEHDEPSSGHHPLYVNSDGGAPEQLLGNPVGSYTDVYALGAVLYQMLTGHEVFTGATRDDIAQQHLHSTIPPLRKWRPSLPTALDRVVARAMAKEPDHRIQTPRELAGAYRVAIAQTQSDATVATAPPARASLHQNMTSPGSARAPSYGQPAQSARRSEMPIPTEAVAPGEINVPDERKAAGATGSWAGSAAATVVRSLGQTPHAVSTRVRSHKNATFMLGILLIVGVTLGSFAWFNGHRTGGQPVAAPGATAEVKFIDNTKNGLYHSDAVSLTVTNLPVPQQGHWYQAWLINDNTEKVLSLGKLVPQSGQNNQNKTYTLSYAGDGSPGKPGTNLLEFGNHVKITTETQNASLPSGPVVLEGTFPPQAFVHIQHLLVAFPTTPQHQGLIVGTMQQMNLLYQQANVLQQWITLHYPISTKCAAQSVIDIIEGTSGQHYKPLGTECNVVEKWPSGDGYGLLGKDGYLAGVADHTALAASAKDATPHIREHAQHVKTAVENITGWLQTVDQDAVKVLAGQNDTTTMSEIVNLTKVALTGQDIDNDESIDPVKNEAGADLAYTHAQFLAILTFGAHQ